MKIKKRISELEIIRFICCLLIVLHHADVFSAYSMNGQYAVGFFFILSGFFMQQDAAKSLHSSVPFVKEKSTFTFILSRFKHIFPYFIVSIAVGLTAWSAMRLVVGPLLWKISHIWPEVFLLQMFASWPSGWWITGVAWFLGALFAGQLLLYPVAKFCAKRSIFGIFVISTFISWGIILVGFPTAFKEPGSIWFGTLRQGLLLAWAGLSFGAALGEIYEYCPLMFLKKWANVRFLLYFIALSAMFTNCPGLWIWGILGCGILLSVLRANTVKSKLSNLSLANFLGEWSITLYLNHYYWALGINTKFPFFPATTKWALYWGLSFLTSLFVWWLVRRVGPYLWDTMQRLAGNVKISI